MVENNYWIGDFILGPILVIGILGTAFWYAYRKDELAAKVKARMTCDDSCHGEDDNYIYKDLFALEGVHELEQRVARLETLLKEQE